MILAAAKLVGQTTPGHVELLESHNFSDGSLLWLAQERFAQLNSTTDWKKTGIVPDVQVSAEWDTYTFQNDPEIAAALKLLGPSINRLSLQDHETPDVLCQGSHGLGNLAFIKSCSINFPTHPSFSNTHFSLPGTSSRNENADTFPSVFLFKMNDVPTDEWRIARQEHIFDCWGKDHIQQVVCRICVFQPDAVDGCPHPVRNTQGATGVKSIIFFQAVRARAVAFEKALENPACDLLAGPRFL